VLARRIRREVLTLCDTALAGTLAPADQFWANATKVEALLGLGRQAEAETLRDTTREARTWSRGRFSELQDRVEAEPYRAAAWALGIGFVAGIVVTLLSRSGTR
jgi:ElaB/YqjD/DUF883 family membrane-anchored ribosome-binding protein